MLSALLMMTVQITTPMNKRTAPAMARIVEARKVYVRFGMPLDEWCDVS